LFDQFDEQAVVRGLRDGRRDAWDALYAQFSRRVWGFVARLIGADSHAVAEIVQESFLAAATSARNFDPAQGTLWNWLSGIAHHQTQAYWRRVERDGREQQLSATNKTQFVDPQICLQQRETAGLVRTILSQLPSDHAALLIGKYLDERSVEELCQEFGGTTEAIRSRLARARTEFREKFSLREAKSPGHVPRPIPGQNLEMKTHD
jgi:RNA polymerase sigma-70 factor (ECF subfamily)